MTRHLQHRSFIIATATLVLTTLTFAFSGCATFSKSPQLTACATERFAAAAEHSGTIRKNAQVKATTRTERDLLNQAGNLVAKNGQTINQIMVTNPIIRQQVLQTIRTETNTTNAVSVQDRTVTVYASIPADRILSVVNKQLGY